VKRVIVSILCVFLLSQYWCDALLYIILSVQLDGDIGDCSCSVESVDYFNNEQVFPIIDELMLRNYFRYYKVLSCSSSVCLLCVVNKSLSK